MQTNKDIQWQHKVVEQFKSDKVKLDRPDGKERFELAVRKAVIHRVQFVSVEACIYTVV